MKKTIYIFGLALTFLFLSACGKKEDSNEIKLPSVTKQVRKAAPASPATPLKSQIQPVKSTNTRPVIIKVYENNFPSKNATVKIKKPTKKSTRKLSWWTAETDEDGNAELLIPKYWKYFSVVAQKDNYALVTFYTNNLVPGNSPIEIEIDLNEQGVIITAELITNKKIDDENFFARITSDMRNNRQSLFAASSTSCTDNKITFPPIKTGLKRMKILVVTKDFAKSYSDYFDTLAGTNKTIQINLLEDVKLNGRAIRKDGTPITNIFIKATPRGLYEHTSIGHISAKMGTDSEGNFIVSHLLEEHYKFTVCADDFDYITTNIVLYSDEENRYLFTFPTNKYMTIKGIVKYEKSDKPAEGIEVNFSLQKRKVEKHTITTDENGKFKIKLPVYNLTYEINEPGYARIQWYINNYDGELIKLYLRDTGIITGKITDEKGEPLSKISAQFMPCSRERYNEMKRAYNARTQLLSDEEGIYIISNAAAPEVYTLFQAHGNSKYILPRKYRREKIEVKPGEVTTFDFIMKQTPLVKVKLIDESGNAVMHYNLDYNVNYECGGSSGTYYINLSDPDGWYKFPILTLIEKNEIKLSLTAQIADDKIAVTNNIKIISGEKCEIILKIDSERKADVSGFVYNSDMTPVIDQYISANVGLENKDSKTDYLGYFEILGMGIKKEATLRLQIWKDNITYSTNVLAGSDNIEWILPKIRNITGRVFIENLSTPATNFAVSVLFQSSKKHFQPADGNFSTPMKYPNIDETFKVYVDVDGYAIVEKDVNPKDINSFNLGDIIVMNKVATISGKIVDKNNNPVRIGLTLMKVKMGRNYGNTESKIYDGSYKFNNVAPGEYFVIAHSELSVARSKPFEVTSGENYIVPDLEILTQETADSISGTVTLDGVPLDKANISFFSEDKIMHKFSKVIKGKFEAKALPGRYAVSCMQKKVVTIVDLEASNDNKIDFESGNSTFEFEMPFENKWALSLIRKLDNIKALVYAFPLKNKKTEKVDNLQAGEYFISAFCWGDANRTNITVETTIKSGETKKIKF